MAAVYLAIIVADLYVWLEKIDGVSIAFSPHLILVWVLYLFTVLALVAFVVGMGFLPRKVWAAILVVYIFTRIFELLTRGLSLSGELETDLYIIVTYLFMVIPPAVTMFYLAFMSAARRESAGSERNSSHAGLGLWRD